MDLAEEEQFGPYLVYERLGVGGMATVHRALERGIEGFERMVALKRLLPHLAEDASFIKSFVREAKLASLLNHVNIVQIFELGRVGTEYFISMEYIDGRDVRRILRHARKVTGPPPIHVTVGVLIQLCDALDYAHSKVDEQGTPLRLVHRDISPSNVLVTSTGHVKVIDFGIAKAQSSQLRTQTGRVKGKLAYMAPEAITGKELDARSDLFAVGVIAHEMLTARPLFASKNEYQTLLKVQRGDIMPPSTFNQACPADLDAIVLRALSREPDTRYANANELRDDLLKLKKAHALQTSYRDIATWVDWAFSLEVPAGGFVGNNTLDQSGSGYAAVVKTPSGARAKSRDEEEAVEIAWGGGEPEGGGESGPVVLDDVPDVSGKHLAANSGAHLGAEARFDELPDDIPTPMPTHGRGSASSIPAPRERRTTNPGHTPARSETRTTDPDGTPLVDGSDAEMDALTVLGGGGEVDDAPDDTRPSMPAARGARSAEPPPAPRPRPSEPPRARGESSIPPILTGRIASTKPGVAPVAARTSTPRIEDTADPRSLLDQSRKRRPSYENTIGSSIAARHSPGQAAPKRTWVIVLGIVTAGAAATAVTLLATRGDDTVKPVTEQPMISKPVKTVGTVKFVTEPVDAEISIEGKVVHTGTPWSTELEAGIHQVSINRTGHKAWLTELELSAGEIQTLRVVLEPLGKASTIADAMLIIRSTPDGLEAVLDGQLLSVKTPIKMPIRTGPHTIVLRQNGVDVWRQELVAQAAADYEYSPSMTADKQRERARYVPRREAISTTDPKPRREEPVPTPVIVDAGVPESRPVIPVDAAPVRTVPADAAPARQVPVDAAPIVKVTPPPPPVRTAAVTVAPTAVTKLAGSTPEIAKSKKADMPSVLAAKVCIDTSGAVSSAQMITKIDRIASSELVAAISSWRYAPYKLGGAATPACFVVSFRVK